MKKLFFFFSILLLAIPCQARIIYVDAKAIRANDGTSWADAYNYLQDALSISSYDDEVLVAEGIYKPDQGQSIISGDRNASFIIINGVILKGGYAGFSKVDPNERNVNAYKTILSGDLNNDDPNLIDPEDLLTHPQRIDNSYHVVRASMADVNTIMDGFVISGGNTASWKGGGFECSYCVATISNCIFSRNAADSGGAIDSFQNNALGDSLKIVNCTFTSNFALSLGGAINNEQSGLLVKECSFEKNCTDFLGGALCNYASYITLERCCVEANTAVQGGGIANYSSGLIMRNCVVAGNKAKGNDSDEGLGAGVLNSNNNPSFFNVHIDNCTFTGNVAQHVGGAIFNDSVSDSNLTNSILWGDSDEVWSNTGTTINVSYCDVQGECLGIGNIDVNALFVAPGNWDQNDTPNDPNDDFWVDGDYHLKSQGWRWDSKRKRWDYDEVTSRCIDAGNPGCQLGDELLSIPGYPDNPYAQNIRLNMGAYGGTAEAAMPPYGWTLLADLTNDGIVNIEDLQIQANSWLSECSEDCSGELDRKENELFGKVVDLADFALLANDWLEITTWY